MAEKVIVNSLLNADGGSGESVMREAVISMEEDEKCRPGPFVLEHLASVNKEAFESTSTVEAEKYRPGPSKNDFEHLPPVNNTTAFETETMRAESLQLNSPMEVISTEHNDIPAHMDDVLSNISHLSDYIRVLMGQLEYQNLDIIYAAGIFTDCSKKLWKSVLEILVKSIAAVQTQLLTFKRLMDYLRQKIQMHNGENFRDLEAVRVKLLSDIEETDLEWTRLNDKITHLKKLIQELNLEQEDTLICIRDELHDIKLKYVELFAKNVELELVCTRLEEKVKAYDMVNLECMHTE